MGDNSYCGDSVNTGDSSNRSNAVYNGESGNIVVTVLSIGILVLD